MNAEEKRALIQHIHGYQGLRTHSNVIISDDTKDRIYQVALAALTAQSYAVSDDTKHMDWLVSKTVNVREPLRYGS